MKISRPLRADPEFNGPRSDLPPSRGTAGLLLAVLLAAATPAMLAGNAAATPPAPAAAPLPAAAPTPNSVDGLLALGESTASRHDFQASEIAYRQVLDNPAAPKPAVGSALLGLARTHRLQGADTKAAAIYQRFLQDFPDDPRTSDALLELGRTLRAMGAYKMAISRFYDVINSAIKVPGDAFEHYKMLARTAEFEIAETHFQSGEYAEATKYYTRLHVLDLAPEDRARAQFKAGYSLRLEGKLDQAAQTLQAFLEQWPADENAPEARYLLALTLRDLGRHERALAVTLELLRDEKARGEADRRRWAYWQRKTGNQLANDFFEGGNITGAQAMYKALLELGSEPGWRLPILYQLGLCYERLGQPEQAATMYQKLLDAAGSPVAPDFAELARMATWRRQQLAWNAQLEHQLTKLLETDTGHRDATQPTALAVAKNP